MRGDFSAAPSDLQINLKDNTFIGKTGHGLILGVAPNSEGPGAQNVIVRGNHFSNVLARDGSRPHGQERSRKY
jgi:hypothetical protein